MGRWSRLLAGAVTALLCVTCAAGPRSREASSPPPAPDVAARQILVTFAPQPALGLPHAGSSSSDYLGSDDYRTTARTRQLARQLGHDYGLTVVNQWPIEALHVHCVVFEVPPSQPREAVVTRLAKDPRVESVEPMSLFSVQSRPGSDYHGLQHNMAELGLDEAQRWASGAGVRVAIVDTGVDLTHPALAGRIGQARDFVEDTAGHHPAERHGTAVAGIIAAHGGAHADIVGVAPAASLLALRACWSVTPGAIEAVCSSFTLAKALSFAIAAHPQIINLSLGGPGDPLLERLVRVALAQGIVVVAARGDTAETRFPSDVAGVVAVLAWPRARGSRADDGSGAVAAPGEEILTAVPGGHYDFLSGSSLAAAEVSGVTALLLEGRKVKPADVGALLRETSRQVASKSVANRPGDDPRLVNACSALARVRPGVRCS